MRGPKSVEGASPSGHGAGCVMQQQHALPSPANRRGSGRTARSTRRSHGPATELEVRPGSGASQTRSPRESVAASPDEGLSRVQVGASEIDPGASSSLDQSCESPMDSEVLHLPAYDMGPPGLRSSLVSRACYINDETGPCLEYPTCLSALPPPPTESSLHTVAGIMATVEHILCT